MKKYKKAISLIFVSAICATTLLMSGCASNKNDKPVSAESLVADVRKNISENSFFDGNFKLTTDMEMSFDGGSMSMNVGADASIKASKDPACTYMNGKINTGILGDMEMEEYVVTDNEGVIKYSKSTYNDKSQWTKEVLNGEDKDSVNIYRNLCNFLPEDGNYTLEETQEKINDKEVYCLKTTLSYADIEDLMNSSGENASLIGEDDKESVDFSKIVSDSYIYIYKDSKLPAKFTIDMTKAFQDAMKEATSESEKIGSMNLKKFTYELTFNSFDKKGSIVVPDNVVSNAKTDSSIFSDDEEDSNGYDISIKGDSDLNLNDSENGYDISIN